MTMKIQQLSIQERIFTNETIERARTMYRNYIDVRLDELQQAKMANKGTVAMLIESELYHLHKNLNELAHFEIEAVQELVSEQELEAIFAPVHTKEVKSRIAVRKNAEKAMATYKGYVDLYLDVLLSATKSGDTARAEEAKKELASLNATIQELASECFG